MSSESIKKQSLLKAPHTVDSTNSSVLVNNLSFGSPENGSLIMNNGSSNKFLAQTLRSYIDALKFDPNTQPVEPSVKKGSSLVVAELLGHNNKNLKGTSKRAQRGNAKSKVTFSSAKSSADYLGQNVLASSSSKNQQAGKREKSKSSTNTVIREWGKRPMLVESEAPWTLRNRMYQSALKNVARAKQLTGNGILANNNAVPYLPRSVTTGSSIVQSATQQGLQYAGNNGNIPVIVQTNNGPQLLSFAQVPAAGGLQQQPVVTGISPMSIDSVNSRRQVALESPQTSYLYQQPGMLLNPQPGMVLNPQQQLQSQSVTYRQLNSQGLWVPYMESGQLRQPQP